MIYTVISIKSQHRRLNKGMLAFLFCNVCKSMEAVMVRRVSDAALRLSGCALTKSI